MQCSASSPTPISQGVGNVTPREKYAFCFTACPTTTVCGHLVTALLCSDASPALITHCWHLLHYWLHGGMLQVPIYVAGAHSSVDLVRTCPSQNIRAVNRSHSFARLSDYLASSSARSTVTVSCASLLVLVQCTLRALPMCINQ